MSVALCYIRYDITQPILCICYASGVMFIVHVIPITKSKVGQLSYYSPQAFTPGSVIFVPLRNKEVPALIVGTEDARAIKSILRTNVYETRKIRSQEPMQLVTPGFVRAAAATAKHFGTSTGSVLSGYIPTAILTAAERGECVSPKTYNERVGQFEQSVLQLSQNERVEKYKTILRGHFAQGHSVFLCAPTIREARFFEHQYSRGIEKYTFLLESSQSKKKQKEVWNAILNEPHPVLIIGTPTFASIPRTDIALFILEHEMSSAYKQQVQPYVDARTLLEYVARETGSGLVHAGTTVSLKVHQALLDGFATELEEHTLKLRTNSCVEIIDVKSVRKAAKEAGRPFPVLSPQSISKIQETSDSGAHTFVFAARRGVASHTVCNDCGTTVTCAQCASPVVLHTSGSTRELLCHRCGQSRDAHETCVTCGSWNLIALGVGIERIEEYVRATLPNVPVFVLSSDTAATPAQAQKIADVFYDTKGAILLGTERALAYLTTPVQCSIMSSIDSLLCVPDFRIEERLFGIIALLREHSDRTVCIETSTPTNAMLKHAQRGSLTEYAREELELRKKLHYPPYTRLIKVTITGNRTTVIAMMQRFVASTEGYRPRVFAGFMKKGTQVALHALIRVPASKWPDEKLLTILDTLPPSVTINVDPERTL